MCSIAAAIAKSGPEIGNHCSAIVPSSRIARLRSRCRNGAASDSNFLRRKVLQFRLPRSCRYDAASDSIFLRRKVELPACCFAVVAGENGPPAALWFSQGRIARLQRS